MAVSRHEATHELTSTTEVRGDSASSDVKESTYCCLLQQEEKQWKSLKDHFKQPLWQGWLWLEDVSSVCFAIVLAFELMSFDQELQFVVWSPYYILESLICAFLVFVCLRVLWHETMRAPRNRTTLAFSLIVVASAIVCGIDLWVLTPSGNGGNLKYAILLNCLKLEQLPKLFGDMVYTTFSLGVAVTMQSLMFFLLLVMPVIGCASIFATRFIGMDPSFAESGLDKELDNSELFSTVPRSLLTLFQVTTLDWGDIVRPSILHEPWLALFWVSFIVYMGIGMMNLSLALMSNAFDRDVFERAAEEKREETNKNFMKAYSLLHDDIVENGDGQLDLEELDHILSSHTVFESGVLNKKLVLNASKPWFGRNRQENLIGAEDVLTVFEELMEDKSNSYLALNLRKLMLDQKEGRAALTCVQREVEKLKENQDELLKLTRQIAKSLADLE